MTQDRNLVTPWGSGSGSYFSILATQNHNMIGGKRSFLATKQRRPCVAEDSLTQVAFSSVVTDR